MSKTSLCTALLGCAALAAPMALADEYRISGPFTHDNLSIFLIHSTAAPRRPAGNYLTLREALDQKKVVVSETGSVNELTVQNLGDRDVYIQSGDIVKGGRQDRVFPDDYVLPSASAKVQLPAFCVEHGRWSRRGSEAADHFSSSNLSLPNKSLKLAARNGQAAQQQVWDQVGMANRKMAASVRLAEPAPPSASPSSLEMAMENKEVKQAADEYLQALSGVIEGKSDVVGFAFAINGQINSADVYASNSMFARMWPKLVRAGALEAMSERGPGTNVVAAAPTSAAVLDFLNDAENGHQTQRVPAGRAVESKKESGKTVLFETRDREADRGWLHKSYVAK